MKELFEKVRGETGGSIDFTGEAGKSARIAKALMPSAVRFGPEKARRSTRRRIKPSRREQNKLEVIELVNQSRELIGKRNFFLFTEIKRPRKIPTFLMYFYFCTFLCKEIGIF